MSAISIVAGACLTLAYTYEWTDARDAISQSENLLSTKELYFVAVLLTLNALTHCRLFFLHYSETRRQPSEWKSKGSRALQRYTRQLIALTFSWHGKTFIWYTSTSTSAAPWLIIIVWTPERTAQKCVMAQDELSFNELSPPEKYKFRYVLNWSHHLTCFEQLITCWLSKLSYVWNSRKSW